MNSVELTPPARDLHVAKANWLMQRSLQAPRTEVPNFELRARINALLARRPELRDVLREGLVRHAAIAELLESLEAPR